MQCTVDKPFNKERIMKFNKLHLNEAILKAVDDLGFEYPTPVQEKVIPELLDKEVDLIGLAETGTGKRPLSAFP